MKGGETILRNFVEGNSKQFIVPVYQRKYDWLTSNCRQLFDDLMRIKTQKLEAHFLGSIVSSGDKYGNNRIVIDGQQRITTISLLLLSGIKAVNDGVLKIDEPRRIDEARECFLEAKYVDVERKIKLIPTESDIETYDRIYSKVLKDKDTPTIDSKMSRNFSHFYEWLQEESSDMTFDDLWAAIGKLHIITIELERGDDPQLIFESLNSTGLALDESDKVRNYMLMSLPPDDQDRCFKSYWQKIDKIVNGKFSMFLRDYLTIRLELPTHVKMDSLYTEWKKYMKDKGREQEMKQMLDYAQYYKMAVNAELPTKRLSEKMRHICNIETDVANVFFVQFFKYAQENNLTDDEMFKVIDLVENYLARRIICSMPANALIQVFCYLFRDVLKSITDYKNADIKLDNSFSDILAYHLLRREGRYALPDDELFKESIKTKDIYHIGKPYQRFLFERLENMRLTEQLDVVGNMKNGDATIEHIMPRTLNDDWKKLLKDDYERIHKQYLNTFANLTITGINGTLSNKSFIEKRDGYTVAGKITQGYKDSIYRLTRGLMDCTKWTEVELQRRNDNITTMLMSLYPKPITMFSPWQRPKDEVFLSDDTFNPKYKKLRGFILFGHEYSVNVWVDMLERVYTALYENYPDQIEPLLKKSSFDEGFYLLKAPKTLDEKQNYYRLIGGNVYAATSMDNRSKLRCLKEVFDEADMDKDELIFLLEPSKTEEIETEE